MAREHSLLPAFNGNPLLTWPPKTANGNYNVRPDGWNIQGANLSNPMYEWSKREYTNNNDNYLAGGKLRYKVPKNLSVEVLGSIRETKLHFL